MKIAYNPLTAAALTNAPANNDITFDLKGLNIFVRGVKFKGTDTTYSVFKKHTSSSGGGYNGLVPVPSYTSTNTRFLREDGNWVIPTNQYTYSSLNNTDLNTLKTEGKWYYVAGGSTNTNGPDKFNDGSELYVGRNASGYRYQKVITIAGIIWFRIYDNNSWSSWKRWYTDANTDNKVLLSNVTTSNFRSVILGYNNSTNPSDLSSSITNLVYTTTKIYAQPSTGIIHANGFYKTGSSNQKVLLGDGSDKALSDFSLSDHIHSNYVTTNTNQTISGVKTFTTLQKFTVASGTSPFTVTSTTKVANLNADLLDGVHNGLLTAKYFNYSTSNIWDCNNPEYTLYNDYGSPGRLVFNKPEGWYYGLLFTIFSKLSIESSLAAQFMWDVLHNTLNPGILWFRTKDGINGWSKNWGRLAYITDNVASATKLQTPRSINGTDFDGTKDIVTSYWGPSRTITLEGAITGSVSINGSTNVTLNTSLITSTIDGRYVGGYKSRNHGSLDTKYTADTYSSTYVNKNYVAFAERGSWDYARNGYITTNFGNIHLAGTSIFLWGASDSAKTQLFITPLNSSGVSSPLLGEMLYYSSNGSGYTSGWTRVVTNRNYSWIITKLGNKDVGSSILPIYLSLGVPKECSYNFNLFVQNYVSVNGKDMDEIKSPHFYYGYTMTNSASKDISNFIVLRYSNDWGTLLQFCPRNENFYIRFWKNAGGVMGSWKTILDSSNYPNYLNSKYARLASPNNLIHFNNEFTIIPDSYSGSIYINYRTSSGEKNGNVTSYIFGDGKGGSLASITKGIFNGDISGQSNYLTIHDIRNTNPTPNDCDDKRIKAWFNNTGTPSSDWWSGITVKGWSDGYAVWQLAGYSSTASTESHLYYRRGLGTSWGSWRTILDSSNYTTYVKKIGTSTVGGAVTPIYLSSGSPTVCSSSTSATASTIAVRDSSGDLLCRLVRSNFANQDTISGALAYRVSTTDNYIRFCSNIAAIRSWLGVPASSHTHTLSLISDLHSSWDAILKAAPNYLSLSGGTMNSGATIKLSGTSYLIQNLNSTSNYTTILKWYKGGESQASYDPSIGQHNTGGGGTGSIVILPYATDTSPWEGSVGLFIAKNTLKLDGKSIAFTSDIPTVPTVTNYYWANIKVSASSSTSTSPTFYNMYATGNVGIGTSSPSTKLHVVGSSIMGHNCSVSEYYSHAEGYNCSAEGHYAHAEGRNSTASAFYSHAEGYYTEASGYSSHAEGYDTEASGDYAHAEGFYTKASGDYAHAEGYYTEASGSSSHAQNYHTLASYSYQTAIGSYNSNSSSNYFIIGNGSSSSRSNAFRVTSAGYTYADGPYSSSGADYAEVFEWIDENINNEDRVGYFVTLKGNKILIASPLDSYILGVVSANPVIIGSNPIEWNKKYLTDEWGRPLYDLVEVNHGNGKITKEKLYRFNPDYDHTKEYKARNDRPEWGTIGLMGLLLVRQDGSLTEGSFCKCGNNGIATKSDSGYYVMEIINNIAKILFR